jgi:hypothetical protein
LYYLLTLQPIIRYPKWVEKIEALDAIAKYKVPVVIASWVTHWTDPMGPLQPGFMYGVREDKLIESGATYIMIGSTEVHHHKPILRQPHREIALPFLRSRGRVQSNNRVFIWNEK